MFDQKTLASIASTLKAGQYNLLLGSGVSLDSRNARGILPSANTFRTNLCRLKGARDSSPLQRVYSTLTPAEVKEHVVDVFRDCQPGPSVTKLTQFLWRRIFTFNIDDALESAYGKLGLLQKSTIFHFDDDYSEGRDLSEVPIVHLHGWAGSPERGFVFSRDEYVRQIKTINPWMVLLTQYLPVEPFIIAGTSLDEVDLDYYLAHRTEVTARDDRGPSILVEPNPDVVTKNDCKRYNLLLFPGTTEQFLDYLSEQVPDRPTPIELIPQETRRLLPAGISNAAALSFSADFELVPGAVSKSESASRFLYGHVASWQDLASDIDISRPITQTIVSEVYDLLKKPDVDRRIVLLADDAGAGKTTTIRRCAFELAQRGVTTFNCSALSRIEPLSTSSVIDLIDDPLLIIVDNFADQVAAVAELVQRLEKKDVTFLCGERDYRQRYVAQSLSGVPFKRIDGQTLRRIDAERLIDLYVKYGLVGARAAVRERDQFAASLVSDPIAVACCRILNDFRPLDRIVDSLTKAASQKDLARYLTASLAQHCHRAGLRHEILVAIAGRDGWAEQFGASHPVPLAYFDEPKRNFIVPENSTLASRILERAAGSDRELLLTIFVDLANAIAPRVNPKAVKQRSPEARLASRLFDYDLVTSKFLGELAGAFYTETQRAWQWNSRYWVQVSLMRLARYYASPSTPEGREALNHAAQHARHAVSIEWHPIPLTAFGQVLLAQMVQEGTSLDATYQDAFFHLVNAIDLERSRLRSNVHPFISLFRGTRDYVRSGGLLSGKQAESLRTLIEEANSKFQRDSEIQEEITQLRPILK